MAKDKTGKKARRKAAEEQGLEAIAARLEALDGRLARLEAALGAGAQAETGGAKKKVALSPFAPAAFPALPPVEGARFSAIAAGVRYAGRLDVMMIELAPGSAVAGVFTRSATRSAPVLWCEARRDEALRKGPPRGRQVIVVNSGNANAFTGRAGDEAVRQVAAAAAEATGAPLGGVWLASTGVIGEPLPARRVCDAMEALAQGLAPERIEDAARAIMTTDTFPKGAARIVRIGGAPVTIVGIAKGSGMIAPNMATMLGFIVTDAAVDPQALQQMTAAALDDSFNAITVDSDTSTSDTVLVAATGRAAAPRIDQPRGAHARAFARALAEVMQDLAHQIVKDGEGATKFVRVEVTGARSARAARRVARAIADSPLVKTALAGEDPNWGRIVAAVGKAGEEADRDKLSIRFGDILVAQDGQVAPGYREEDGAAYMKRAELEITVDLGVGRGRGRIWTCDLTKRYIEINADYRS
ncbi:bifunctional glutamate N-acetyltransferase/amino-acid acetyltransferase ArgJ [Oceanicella actignis]|uniref:bifunctional glutamate N-acetyltransferase/amino-acid acetyltransferase ArgJ n=1 Tax=Oceanicella actignis TaxID=1189325 RepID=UPI0011E6F0C8|nr:bifunctional glutamate N-acetyltransferase/amino-acid acetyltransferase ArgJ [Oceanicella actignis]TYO88248.1 glutamate N-acetyltransferase [Oceanicella actignis]